MIDGPLFMILEIAQIDIKPGMEEEFERRAAHAVQILKRARGCGQINLHRCIERPSSYRLLVEWETLENHTVDFHSSDDFRAWRALLSPCFERLPAVEHARMALSLSPE